MSVSFQGGRAGFLATALAKLSEEPDDIADGKGTRLLTKDIDAESVRGAIYAILPAQVVISAVPDEFASRLFQFSD